MFFEAPGMRCHKRPRSFLWIFRWEDHHDFEIIPGSVKLWGFDKWELRWRCKSCGAEDRSFGICESDLLRLRDSGEAWEALCARRKFGPCEPDVSHMCKHCYEDLDLAPCCKDD